MCGIAGWIDYQASRQDAGRLLEGMKRAIWHRGPDEEGSRRRAGGDRDAAPRHHRPRRRAPADGQRGRDDLDRLQRGDLQLPRLRPELERQGHLFAHRLGHRGHPAPLRGARGRAAPRALEGMFAFAIWDTGSGAPSWRATGWGRSPSSTPRGWAGLLFGSELKALLCHPGLSREIDLQALRYLPGPQLHPGPADDAAGGAAGAPRAPPGLRGGRVRESAYWTLRKGDPPRGGRGGGVPGDVRGGGAQAPPGGRPPGAFLSGGIDFSAVVATMQRAMGAPARTFCLAFEEESWGSRTTRGRWRATWGGAPGVGGAGGAPGGRPAPDRGGAR